MIKVVFFATPDIALKSFEFFINSSDYEVLALVTQKAKPTNRGKKIIERNITCLAKDNNITVFEPDRISKDIELIEKLKSMEPDFFVTFAFGQILSQQVIDIPKIATINLHASLLPKYRGANPICEAIEKGEKQTGITTMKTVLALDAGDICLSEKIDIPFDMNAIELMEEISKQSPLLLDKTLKGLKNGEITPICQKEEDATFTKKITKEQKVIDWNSDAICLHNKIRAMHTINTNHMTCKGKIIKVLKTDVVECKGNECGKCGEIIDILKDGVVVKCANDALKIITVKPEGKGEMKACDWIRGARVDKGECFE